MICAWCENEMCPKGEEVFILDGDTVCECCAIEKLTEDLTAAFDVIFYGQGMMQ